MSTYRETRLRAGLSIVGAIDSFFKGIADATRKSEQRSKERRKQEAERRRMEGEERRRAEAQRLRKEAEKKEAEFRRRRQAEQEQRRADEETGRRIEEEAVAAMGEIAAVEDLFAGSVTPVIERFAGDGLAEARRHLTGARDALSAGLPDAARAMASKALKVFDAARKAAAKNSQTFDDERRRAVEACHGAVAMIDAAREADETIRRWKGPELQNLAARIGDADKALASGDFAAVHSTVAEVAAGLERARTEAHSMERQRRLNEAYLAAITASLGEMGFDVINDREDPEDPASRMVVVACRQTGEEFSAVISFEGIVNYRFDEYEGETCRGAAEDLERTLVERYDVRLEGGDHAAPDSPKRIGKEAKSLPISRTASAGHQR